MVSSFDRSMLPVAVIGAGPVGLAAAAHLVRAGETPLLLERGSAVGASMRAWGHVRVFSPWQYNIDPAAKTLLLASGWSAPDDEAYATGGEIVREYLEPLAALPEIAPHLRLGAQVVAVTRLGFDKMKTVGREDVPFQLQIKYADGREDVLLAKAVIDASGTWESPNPLGSSGVPAIGERKAAASGRIHYGIPDLLGAERDFYAGKRVLVIGSGHSAFNALSDLVELTRQVPDTTVQWAIRRQPDSQMYGGGEHDQLAERGNLGRKIERFVDGGVVRMTTGFRVTRIDETDDGLVVWSGERRLPPVDAIIATTGFRPALSMLTELRLDLDSAIESPSALAPMIDPNVHFCGTVRPHGAEELRHPETDFYIAGMKSYGRAPTFLMLTGFEQVRSIVRLHPGDWEAARRVELTLPETGVCTLSRTSGDAAGYCTTATGGEALAIANIVSCCGAPEPELVGVGAGRASSGTCCG